VVVEDEVDVDVADPSSAVPHAAMARTRIRAIPVMVLFLERGVEFISPPEQRSTFDWIASRRRRIEPHGSFPTYRISNLLKSRGWCLSFQSIGSTHQHGGRCDRKAERTTNGACCLPARRYPLLESSLVALICHLDVTG
jgi:hypothetical protein